MAKKGGAPTKSEVMTHISKDTGLSRKQVGSVFDSLGGVIKKSLRGNGLFTMPGLLKMKVVKKPATKAREGINPFTGQKMMFKAKPASKKVRVMPLKSLKRSEEHTSELQSRSDLVCRLLLEKKKKKQLKAIESHEPVQRSFSFVPGPAHCGPDIQPHTSALTSPPFRRFARHAVASCCWRHP